ncbi:MAG: ATP-binding protein, partial [Candidatus Kariarchaeaceae archaeon]
MDPIVEELTGPTNPQDFVGRSAIIDAYHDLLREIVRSNNTIKWIHISGVAGTGKSSLLRKLRMMTEMERIATGSVEIPISPRKANQFLNDIKRVIDEMSPEWRTFIQRKRNVSMYNVPDLPEASKNEVTDSVLEKIKKAFFEDLDKVDKAMKNEKQRHGIFLDDVDRFLSYNYTSFLSVWQLIAKKLMEDDYNLILVTSGHYTANRYLGLTEENEYCLHLKLNQFDFTEAELMVRRRGKLVKSEREKVVQASTRFPFDLALRQLILSNGLDPSNLNAKIITQIFGFTKEEVNLLR